MSPAERPFVRRTTGGMTPEGAGSLMRILPLLALLAALSASGTAGGAGQGAVVEVQTLAGSFSPEVIEVRPGDVVVWRNVDGRGHTVTSAWDDGETFHAVLRPGESFSAQFTAEGEYAIRCLPHSVESGHGGHEGMVATVRVIAPAAAVEGSQGSGVGAYVVAGTLAVLLLGAAALWVKSGGAFPWPRARPTRRT